MRLAGVAGFGIQLTGLLEPLDRILATTGLFVGVGDVDTGLSRRILVRPSLMIQDQCLLVLFQASMTRTHGEVDAGVFVGLLIAPYCFL